MLTRDESDWAWSADGRPDAAVLGAQRGAGRSKLVRAWVPMDDEHTMFFVFGAAGGVGAGIDLDQVQPNTTEWCGRFRLPQNASNDYQIDRRQQRTLQSYIGLSSVYLEDLAITESMARCSTEAPSTSAPAT